MITKALELTFVEVKVCIYKTDKNLAEGYNGEAGSTGTVALITIE